MKMRATHILITAVLLVAAVLLWFVTSPEIPTSKPTLADTPAVQPPENLNFLSKDHLIPNPPPPVPPQVLPTAVLPPPPDIDPKVAAMAQQNFYNDVVASIAAELSTTMFFRNLPEDKRNKLLKTLADNETSFMEYASGLAMRGKILDERQLVSLKKEQEQNVKSVLSDPEYREYEQFEATRPDRSILAQTSDRLERPYRTKLLGGC